MPERAGTWKTQKLEFKERPGEVFNLWYRNPIEAIKSLWSDHQLSPEMVFAGQKVFSDATRENQIFSEMWTAKWWHILQVRILFIIALFLLLKYSRHFFQKVPLWLQSLSPPTKHN